MTGLRPSSMRVLFTALCGAWLGSAALPVLAADCPVPSAPAGARVEMIAPQVEGNGLDTSIRAVTVAMPVAGVLGHYRTLWAPLATPSRPGSLENEAAGWKIISSIDGRCLTTVQVKPQGLGSYALVSVARIQDTADRVATARTLETPLPPGARVLSDSLQGDPIRKARTVVAMSHARVSTNADFYTSNLRNQGWIAVMRRTVPTDGGPSEVLHFKRDTTELSVVIAPAAAGQVSIVSNLVDRP